MNDDRTPLETVVSAAAYYQHGYSTAQRGFGPNSPRSIEIGSIEWGEWHKGWKAGSTAAALAEILRPVRLNKEEI